MADMTFDDLIPSGGASAPAQGGGGLSFDDLVPPKEKTWWERGAVRPTTLTTGDVLKLGEAAAPSFKEGFGDQPLGSMVKPDPDYPKTSAAWQLASVPAEIVGRTISGGVHTLGASAAGVHELLGGNPDEARRFGRDIAGMAESRMFDVGQHVPKPAPAPTGVRVPTEQPLPRMPEPPVSPMTPREGTNARLLPPEYEGTGAAGDPHYDAAWDALGGTRSAGAAGVPGGPLAGYDPKAIAVWRDILKEQGYTPWEMDHAIESMSNHGFLGELTEATREEMRSLHSLGKEGGNIIRQATNQRREERPERVAGYIRDAFGLRSDPRVEKAQRQKEFEEARPFWDAFEKTPIPPTEALDRVKGRLEASGAWAAASKAMREEGIPIENHFVELPNTGEYVLANPALPSETIRVPTARFYQAAKEHLDGLINYAVEHNQANDARRYVGIKKALDAAINNHEDVTVRGVWRDALNKSAGPLQWDAAVGAGERVLTENVKYRDFDMLWDTLSDQQKAGYAEGIAQNLEDMLGRKGNADTNTIKHIMGPNNQRKLQRVLEDTKSERLLSRIKHEETIGAGPLTGPNTANKLTGQKRYLPQDTIAQTFDPSKTPATLYQAGAFGVKKGLAWWQQKSIKEAQQKQDKINADIAHISTLQGAERNAVLRYLAEIPDDIAGSSAPSPRPAPARAAGEMEPPPHSQVPEGPPGYPQPEMTAVEATKILRDFGYDQGTINSMGGTTRVQTADMLQRNYPKGPPSRIPEFPGEAQGEHAAEAGEGLEPSPQPGGMAARGKRAAGEGESGARADLRDTGARDRTEKEPLRRDVIERGRSGRPIETKPLAIGKEDAIIDAAVRRNDKTDRVPTNLTRAQLERMSFDELSRMAFGHVRDEQLRLDPKDIKIKYKGDMENPEYKFEKQGMKWVRSVKFDEPIQVSIGRDGSFYLEDGHHRYFAAKKLGIPLDAVIEKIDGKAIETILRRGVLKDDARPFDDRQGRASGGRVDASAINSNPTEAQKEAGNYAKDHVRVHGLDITIENAKGSKRSGIDKGGKPWSVALPAHYGYIKGSVGADKDHVDVYLGPHLKSRHVFVIDQKDAETGKFDEHKCLVGFASAKQARNCYLKAFSDGKGKARLGAMHEADIDGFKMWLAAGDTTKPIGKIAA